MMTKEEKPRTVVEGLTGIIRDLNTRENELTRKVVELYDTIKLREEYIAELRQTICFWRSVAGAVSVGKITPTDVFNIIADVEDDQLGEAVRIAERKRLQGEK